MLKLKLNGYFITAVVAVSTFATSAVAENGVRQLPSAGSWSVTPEIGTSINLDGGFVDGDSLSLEATGANVVCTDRGKCFLGFTVQTAFTATVESQDFDDVYDSDIGLGVSVNYGLSDNSEVFGRVRYTSYDASSFTIATADTAGALYLGGNAGAVVPFAAGTQFIADMDDYEEFSLTAGYRHFFMGGNGFHPFASVEAGVAFVDAIEMKLSTSGGSLGKVGFYDDSTIFTGGLGAGFRYDVAENMAVGVETTVRYIDELDSDDDIAGGENDGDSRWDLALFLGLTWQF